MDASPVGGSADVQATVGDDWKRFVGTAVSASGPVPGYDATRAQAFFEMRVNVRDAIVLHDPAPTGTISFFAVNTITERARLRAVHRGRGSDVPAVRLDHERVGGERKFVFGTPFDYVLDLEIVDAAPLSSTGRVTPPGIPAATSFVGDFGRTIAWAGVPNVRDAAGDPAADVTAFSGTGADFRQAIVAPAPVTLPDVCPLFASAPVMPYAGRRTVHKRRRALAAGDINFAWYR